MCVCWCGLKGETSADGAQLRSDRYYYLFTILLVVFPLPFLSVALPSYLVLYDPLHHSLPLLSVLIFPLCTYCNITSATASCLDRSLNPFLILSRFSYFVSPSAAWSWVRLSILKNFKEWKDTVHSWILHLHFEEKGQLVRFYRWPITKARQTHADFLSLKLFLFVRDPKHEGRKSGRELFW